MRNYNSTDKRKKWLDEHAAKVDAVLAWGWCFADRLADELNLSPSSLAQVISHMRNAQGKAILTAGHGAARAYEYDDRATAAQERDRYQQRNEPLT